MSPPLEHVAIFSRIRSAVTSRSNCAKDNRTLSVSRPIDDAVLEDFCLDQPIPFLRVAPILASSTATWR